MLFTIFYFLYHIEIKKRGHFHGSYFITNDSAQSLLESSYFSRNDKSSHFLQLLKLTRVLQTVEIKTQSVSKEAILLVIKLM